MLNTKHRPVFGPWLSVAEVYKQFNFNEVRVSPTLTTPVLKGQCISLLTASLPKPDRHGWPYDQLVYLSCSLLPRQLSPPDNEADWNDVVKSIRRFNFFSSNYSSASYLRILYILGSKAILTS